MRFSPAVPNWETKLAFAPATPCPYTPNPPSAWSASGIGLPFSSDVIFVYFFLTEIKKP